jgi:EAL domain-containing protein (putative c-di-GMP-specific phosphodiesterase class I)
MINKIGLSFQTIIAMAKSLGMQVIAEGIKNADQAKMLLEMRFEQAQGYFFG